MKLTPELLLSLGFRQVEPDSYRGKMTFFRFTPPKHETFGYYMWELQVSIGSGFNDSNPNSGMVYIFLPAQYTRDCTLQRIETTIASHVNTLERLNAIYTGLTDLAPLTPTNAVAA